MAAEGPAKEDVICGKSQFLPVSSYALASGADHRLRVHLRLKMQENETVPFSSLHFPLKSLQKHKCHESRP